MSSYIAYCSSKEALVQWRNESEEGELSGQRPDTGPQRGRETAGAVRGLLKALCFWKGAAVLSLGPVNSFQGRDEDRNEDEVYLCFYRTSIISLSPSLSPSLSTSMYLFLIFFSLSLSPLLPPNLSLSLFFLTLPKLITPPGLPEKNNQVRNHPVPLTAWPIPTNPYLMGSHSHMSSGHRETSCSFQCQRH